MIVDADAHINEDVTAWTELAQARPGWIGVMRSGSKHVAGVEGRPYPQQVGLGCGVPIDSSIAPPALAGATDLDQRMRDLDAEGIDVQVLYGGLILGLTGYSDAGLTGYSDAGLATDVARAYNDWLLTDVCSARPRLKGVAVLALQDVRGSIAEMQRAKALGAVAVTVPPVVGARTLDDPGFAELWAEAEHLDLAVGVHSAPGMHLPLPAAGLFANYAQVHLLSFPVDQLVAFTALALGGVLDRHPRLRVAFLESGVGWVPWFLSRAQEHKDKRAELLPGLRTDLRELARRQCFFSFECEDEFLGLFAEHVGTESMVYASDYPHWDTDFPGTVVEAEKHCAAAGLSDAAVAQVMGTNAQRLYDL